MIEGVTPGRGILWADWAGTALFVVAAAVAAVVLGPVRYVAVGVSLMLFAVGCGAFLVAYWTAVQRSRVDEIGVGGLFFLAGEVAPKTVRWWMNGALAVQIAVALATSAARPFTTLAFGWLVPMFGIGMNGLWGARHGTFGRRIVGTGAARRTDAERDSGGGIEQNANHG